MAAYFGHDSQGISENLLLDVYHMHVRIFYLKHVVTFRTNLLLYCVIGVRLSTFDLRMAGVWQVAMDHVWNV